jgi:predicted ABC-type ATPase
MSNPTFTIIAGVNGSGKTTFALDYFKDSQITFINADLIATGLSPTNPDISQFVAGKLMLHKMKGNIITNFFNNFLHISLLQCISMNGRE